MNRGDRRKPIFRDDEDRTRFLSTLGACVKTGWQVEPPPRHIGSQTQSWWSD
jgi:hypothetical protein